MQLLTITNVSQLKRYGVKGAQAAKWLAEHGVVIPKEANTWVQNDQTLVLRLGGSEFLIEDSEAGNISEKLAADNKRIAGVYKVPRLDASWILAGSGVRKLLFEVCALDLRESALPENAVVMTQVAGISATVLRQTINNETVYRMWCDGTYNEYIQHVLDEIAQELKN